MKIKVNADIGLPGIDRSKPYETHENALMLIAVLQKWRENKLSKIIWRQQNVAINLTSFRQKLLGGRTYMCNHMLNIVETELAELAMCMKFQMRERTTVLTLVYVDPKTLKDPLAAMEFNDSNPVADCIKALDEWIDTNPPKHAIFERRFEEELDPKQIRELNRHVEQYADTGHYWAIATATLCRLIRKEGYETAPAESTIETPELPPE